MRISTQQIHQSAVASMLEQQTQVSKTQTQLASGKRILTPSDDPIGAARIVDLKEELAITGQYQKNSDAARSRLSMEEGTMIGVGNVLQRAREIAIQGNNDTLSNEDRESLAVEVRQLLDEALSLANTRDPNGEYIFAGFQGKTQPFAASGAGFSYSGDDGQRFLQIGPSRQVAISDSGTQVFRAIRNGNGTFATQEAAGNSGSGIINPGSVKGSYVLDTYTIAFTQALPTDPITYSVTGVTSGVVVAAGTTYTDSAEIAFNGVSVSVSGTPANGDTFTVSPSANQDIFTTLQNLAQTLESGTGNDADRAHLHNAINRFLVDVDQANENVLNVRARIGARLSAIDSQYDLNEDYKLKVQETLSLVEDLDYAEATSRLNLQMVGLDAAQKSFIRIQGLSLFNYL